MNHTNYTLGRNLLDTNNQTKTSSFVYLKINGEPAVGILQDSLYYSKTNVSKHIRRNTDSIKDI